MANIDLPCSKILAKSLTLPEIMEVGKKKRIGITAGLGAGKTHLSFQRHHILCGLNQKAPFSAVFYPTYDKIFNAGIPTYQKVLTQFGLNEDDHYTVIKSPYPKIIYKGYSGHEVHFHSAAVKPDLINAVEYSHATGDESGSVKNREILDMIHSRVRDGNSLYPHTVYTGVPVGMNFYADLFDSDSQSDDWDYVSKTYHKHKAKQLYRFKLSVLDNPYIPEDYVDSLIETFGHDEALLRAYIHGEFTARAANLAAPSYLPHVHDIEPQEADPTRPIYLTMDFNYDPVGWVAVQQQLVWQYEDRFWRWVCLDSSSGSKPKLRPSIVEFAAKFPRDIYKNTEILLYGDRSGHSRDKQTGKSDFGFVKNILNELGYTNVSIRAQREVILQKHSIDALDRAFFDNILFVCSNCTKLKESLLKTETIEGKRELDKPAGETHTHHYDAIKYLAYEVLYKMKGQEKPRSRVRQIDY